MVAIRQFAQRTCRDRERQHRRVAAQPTNRELAQRARRNRQHPFDQQLPINNTQLAQRARQNREHEPIARQPLPPQLVGTVSFHHRLGPCDVPCSSCGAKHWIEERVQGSSKSAPRFSSCCQNGAIVMDKFEDPPQPLYSLLMDVTPSIFPYLKFTDG